jgi:hypothetical protein
MRSAQPEPFQRRCMTFESDFVSFYKLIKKIKTHNVCANREPCKTKDMYD